MDWSAFIRPSENEFIKRRAGTTMCGLRDCLWYKTFKDGAIVPRVRFDKAPIRRTKKPCLVQGVPWLEASPNMTSFITLSSFLWWEAWKISAQVLCQWSAKVRRCWRCHQLRCLLVSALSSASLLAGVRVLWCAQRKLAVTPPPVTQCLIAMSTCDQSGSHNTVFPVVRMWHANSHLLSLLIIQISCWWENLGAEPWALSAHS